MVTPFRTDSVQAALEMGRDRTPHVHAIFPRFGRLGFWHHRMGNIFPGTDTLQEHQVHLGIYTFLASGKSTSQAGACI